MCKYSTGNESLNTTIANTDMVNHMGIPDIAVVFVENIINININMQETTHTQIMECGVNPTN